MDIHKQTLHFSKMRVHSAIVTLTHIVAMLSLCAGAMAQEVEKNDSTTNAAPIDQKSNSEKKGKFLIVPLIITEPAIGEGAGAGLVYFHGKDNSARPRVANGRSVARTTRNSTPPPSVTGVMGFYTNNDTQGVGIGHSSTWRDDRYRLSGILADATVNSEIYILDTPFGFEIDGKTAYGSVKRRLGDSDLFLGLSLMVLDADVNFKLQQADAPSIPLLDFSLTNIGVAGNLTYDRRNNTTMPNAGQLIDFSIWRYDETLGSDFEYTTGRLKLLSFHPLHKNLTLGLRVDISTASGEPPFFAVPYVSLRGIPALRFRGKTAGAFEVEGRYQFAERWSGAIFAGTGFTDIDRAPQESSQNINSYGAGFRFKALQVQNVWLGIDMARGPEDTAWYFQVGQGW